MTRSYSVWESYDSIDFNPEDYPELEGMSEEEIVEYLNENMYEFELNGSSEGSLVDEFMFNMQETYVDFEDLSEEELKMQLESYKLMHKLAEQGKTIFSFDQEWLM